MIPLLKPRVFTDGGQGDDLQTVLFWGVVLVFHLNFYLMPSAVLIWPKKSQYINARLHVPSAL